LDWGILWDGNTNGTYPYTRTFTNVDGSGIDITLTIPRQHRSGNSDYVAAPGNDLNVYTGSTSALRFWRPDDTNIDQITLSFSAPVVVDRLVTGGARFSNNDYGTIELKVYDGPNLGGSVVLPNSFVHSDHTTTAQIVRGVPLGDPAGEALTMTDGNNTGGQDLNGGYATGRTGVDDGYVILGLTEPITARNWGIVDYQGVEIQSVSWELWQSNVNDVVAARTNRGSGGAISAYLGSFNFSVAGTCDLGDLPDSYDATMRYNDGARHVIGSAFLGARIDSEGNGQTSAGADGDDNDTSPNDEDGVTAIVNGNWTAGSVQSFTVVASQAGELGVWIDWNNDGDFGDSNEFVTMSVSAGPNTVNVTVGPGFDWQSDSLFTRFRLFDGSTPGANDFVGQATNGEVEDYVFAASTLPISLASVDSEQSESGLFVEWTTATETRNAGFHLYGRVSGEETWWPLTEQLVPSQVIDSLEPHRYSARFASVIADELLIEDWDTRGQSERHGPFAVGRLHGFDAESNARSIDWQAIRSENARALKVRRGIGSGAAPMARSSSGNAVPVGGEPDALLWVSESGVQRIGFDALQAAGADLSNVLIEALSLSDDGDAHPRHVIDANDNGVFDSGDSVEFLGEINPTLYSARNAYRLGVDPTLVREAKTRTLGARNAAPSLFGDWVQFEQQRAYSFAAPGADPWYDEWLFANGAPASLTRSFDMPGYAGTGALLRLSLWGVTDWPGEEPDHHVIVKVNGQAVDEGWFDGSVDATRTIELPAVLLRSESEGNNNLVLEAPGDTGHDYDIQALDSFRIGYERLTQAHDGAWQGTIPRGVKILIDGFQGEAVAWKGKERRLSDGDAPLIVRGKGKWVAADTRAIRQPSVQSTIPAPVPKPQKKATDYLIVSHAQFMDTKAMAGLVALQQSRGYSTAVVDVARLYAAYSDFEVDPEAIRRYLKKTKPNFVLFVGADSYDYHDYLGLASQSFVPTRYVATDDLITYAPADSPYVAYKGNGVPQAAIGRLPVRTETELDQLVANLQSYVPASQAVLSSGPSDSGRQFAAVSEGYAAQLPVQIGAHPIAVDDLGLGSAKAELLDELNALVGALVSFVGHSSYAMWGLNPTGALLVASEARGLINASPHLITQWGCWNTYFVNPNQDTMANAFLFQDHGAGAAAVLGATALTDLGLLQGLGEAFFDQIGRKPTIGEVLLKAQKNYARDHPQAAAKIRAFTLLGDPAMEP
jgi:hypothetical protein